MRRPIFVVLLALSLVSCARHESGVFDGRFVTAKTEKGEFRLTLPKDDVETSEVGDGKSLDGIVSVARSEMKSYTEEVTGWEMEAVIRAAVPDRRPFYTVHFSRQNSTQWIIIPVSFGGRILASPVKAERK